MMAMDDGCGLPCSVCGVQRRKILHLYISHHVAHPHQSPRIASASTITLGIRIKGLYTNIMSRTL